MMPHGMDSGFVGRLRVELELEGRAIGRQLGLGDADGPGLQANLGAVVSPEPAGDRRNLPNDPPYFRLHLLIGADH